MFAIGILVRISPLLITGSACPYSLPVASVSSFGGRANLVWSSTKNPTSSFTGLEHSNSTEIPLMRAVSRFNTRAFMPSSSVATVSTASSLPTKSLAPFFRVTVWYSPISFTQPFFSWPLYMRASAAFAGISFRAEALSAEVRALIFFFRLSSSFWYTGIISCQVLYFPPSPPTGMRRCEVSILLAL